MKKIPLILLLLISVITQAQTTLTHNVGNNLLETSIYTCSWGGIEWARAFVLEDFGISTNEEFVISIGQVGFSAVGVFDVNISFNIYEIDNDFPSSFLRENIIGSSEIIRIYQSGFQLVTLEFENPVVVPSNVERILVEVRQEFSTSSAITFIAGTAEDNDYSWFNTLSSGCAPDSYTTTEELNRPDARFYINVTGEKILSVDEVNNKIFKIYPNPTQDILNIQSQQQIEAVSIYNLQGQLFKEDSSSRVDVSHLSNGLYFVRVTIEGKTITKKFIKE